METQQAVSDEDKQSIEKYKFKKFIDFFRLNDATSRQLLRIVNNCYAYDRDRMKKFGDLCGKEGEFAQELLSDFQDWRSFLYCLGTYICEVDDLTVLRVMCGWAFIALAFIELKINKIPSIDKEYLEPRDLQTFDVVYKILCYSCRQNGSPNIRWFLSVFGDEFFDQIVGLVVIDRSFDAPSFVSYLTTIIIAMNPAETLTREEEMPGIGDGSLTTKAYVKDRDKMLREFFNDYALYIMPRVMFFPEVLEFAKQLVDIIVQKTETDKERLIRNNFVYILDYHLRKAPTAVTLDTVLNTHDIRRSTFFFSQRGTMSMFVAIFNLSINRAAAMKMIDKIVETTKDTRDNWMETKFLGLLLHIRNCILCDKYFLRRKHEFAASLKILFETLKPSLLCQFAAKIFQTLWLINTEAESFKECWLTLFEKLDMKTLTKYAYRILFYISQLTTFEEVAQNLLVHLSRPDADKKHHDEIAAILHQCYGIGNWSGTFTLPIAKSALEAVKKSPHLCYEILPKIFAELNTGAQNLEQKLELLDNLLPLVGPLKCVEEVSIVGSCLGKIGAISPVYLSNVPATSLDRDRIKISSVGAHLLNEEKMFINEFVRKCLSRFSENDNSTQSDMIGFSLQCIAKEFENLPSSTGNMLDSDLKRELSPFLTSTYALNRKNELKETPLITSVNSHDEWIVEWFCKLSGFVGQQPFKLLHCLTLSHVGGESPAIFSDFLPLLILCCLREMTDIKIQHNIYDEIVAVFSSVGHRVDVKDSCQFIFSFFSNVEDYFFATQKSESLKDVIVNTKNVSKRFFDLKKRVMAAKVRETDKFPTSVISGIACSNYYSVLEIIEQNVVKKDRHGTAIFDRELFSLLERLYYNVNDVENTQGAYLHIINNSVPSSSETILNSEISGNIVEILPMIANSEENREVMSKCILRLNQPELALAYVKHNFSELNREQMQEQYPYAYAVFSVCAMELGRWDLIEEEVTEVQGMCQWQPFNEPPPVSASESVQTFHSHLASMLACCRRGRFERAGQYFDLAQVCATRSLFKTNAEGDRPYNMGFEYVQQLHSLADVQMAWPQLSLDVSVQLKQSSIKPDVILADLLKTWKEHDKFISPNNREMEPILSVRRNILRSLGLPEQQLKSGLTDLLVQSCKLARNDDLPNLVLPCLTEALKNGMSNIDIEEQRALYYLESLDENKRLHAIPTLNNAIAQFFPRCSETLQDHINSKAQVAGRVRTSAITPSKKLTTFDTLKTTENCDRFLESAVLLMNMAQKQRETCVTQILKMYEGLEQMKANSEQFFYNYANFVDSTFKNHTDSSIRLLIRLCVATLKFGDTYASELMQKMITVWLDTVPVLEIHSNAPKIEKINTDPSAMILDAFGTLPRLTFYGAFPLLVSRLAKFSKKNRSIYNVMKKIMAGLLTEYPHQCILLSIGEFRSALRENDHRQKAMADVYQAASLGNNRFKQILEAYKFITGQLMNLANKKVNSSQMDLNAHFGDFTRYFQRNVPAPIKNKNAMNVPDKIQIPVFFKYMEHPFTRIDESTVVITQIENFAKIMQTLARPKCIKVRGSDGVNYSILCKPEDELRKDARFMDLARMLNARSTSNRYTRNLNVRIRTFCVIPLQEKGGIIEWVPNVAQFGECISQGSCTNTAESDKLRNQIKQRPQDPAKLVELHNKLTDLYKLKMAEFLRKISTGPASYYQIQRKYTVSTAFMCSVGFVVGLGDRHVGNILIDQSTGEIMHVDFCLLFNAGERLNVPEKVPFRLTRNVVDGFGPIGIEGRFRFVLERTMSFMQQEKTAALTCLKSLLHDPLIEWKAKEEKSAYDENSINARIENVESRLSGYSHTLLIKKTGPFSIRGLAAKQIEMAMDENILAEMYVGWAGYL